MDALISSAARALGAGDPLGALKRIALREDPPALALRGIAMAQLGEYARARELLRRAGRGFGAHEPVSRARCVVAEAEVALALRELNAAPRALEAAAAVLAAHGDRANALHARLVVARRFLLLGRLGRAAQALAAIDTHAVAPVSAAVIALIDAEIALRSLRAVDAGAALSRAAEAAARAGVPALQAEVAEMAAALTRPAARLHDVRGERDIDIAQVESLLRGDTLIVDGCRHAVRVGPRSVALARRPVLFALAQALGMAWPQEVERDVIIARAFRLRRPDDTHRARLRVELGRLRALLRGLAEIESTARGFVLRPESRKVAVLAPPVDGEAAALVALLSDGAAWSSSALALALGTSQRSVQRALLDLEAAARVRAVGQGRARRWLAPPLSGIATILLLPAALPGE